MKTTTDPENWRFYFTVTDLARFLGKSPVTIRGWERKGLVSIPRDPSGDRKMTATDIRDIATVARGLKRINEKRWNLVNAAVTLIEQVEAYNEHWEHELEMRGL